MRSVREKRSVENEECGKCGVWKVFNLYFLFILIERVFYNIVTHAFKLKKKQ